MRRKWKTRFYKWEILDYFYGCCQSVIFNVKVFAERSDTGLGCSWFCVSFFSPGNRIIVIQVNKKMNGNPRSHAPITRIVADFALWKQMYYLQYLAIGLNC